MRSQFCRLAAMFLLSLVADVAGAAESVADAISRHRNGFFEAAESVLVIQRRMVKDGSAARQNEGAFTQLNVASSGLLSAARECDVLLQTMILTTLVTEESQLPRAKNIFTLQVNYMLSSFARATTAIENGLPLSQSSEAVQRLLDARDRLRSASEFLQSIEFNSKLAK